MHSSLRIAVGLVGAAFVHAGAHGAMMTVNFELNGQQVLPDGNDTDALGVGTMTFDTETKTFDLDLFVVGIGLDDLLGVGPNDSAVNLYRASSCGCAFPGPIAVDLGYFASFQETGDGLWLRVENLLLGGDQGGLTSDVQENFQSLMASQMWANIHTNAFETGEIRGRIIIPAPSGGALTALVGWFGLMRRRRR